MILLISINIYSDMLMNNAMWFQSAYAKKMYLFKKNYLSFLNIRYEEIFGAAHWKVFHYLEDNN